MIIALRFKETLAVENLPSYNFLEKEFLKLNGLNNLLVIGKI